MEVKGPDILGCLQEHGFLPQMQCKNDKPSGLPAKDKASTDGYPAAHVESENSTGYGTPEVLKRTGAGNISYSLDSSYMSEQLLLPVAGGVTTRNDAELQAKSATVKSWACVNFSCIGNEELLKFLHSLGRICVKNGMDFSLEPTMLVHMSSPCRDDMVLGLYIVHEFFDHHEMKKGEPKFIPVILPDDKCSDEKVEKICKDIGVVYQCCLPLYDRMAQKKYLEIVTNEIKAKVMMECDRLSDSCNDTSGDLMAGYDGYSNEEMGEYDGYDNEEMREYDSYNNEEMGEDDGNSCGEMGEDDVCNEMESLQLCSSDNELCKYTSKERRSEASHSSGSLDREISEQQLLSAEDFTTMTDGTLQVLQAV